MSDEPQRMMYSVDTNVFMDWHVRYYPTDIFPTLVVKLDDMIAAGQILCPVIVKEELDAVGTAQLSEWAKNRAQIFVPLVEVLAQGLSIQSRFPGMKDPKALYEEADAYVIALAALRNGTVVTQETSASEKHKSKRSHYIPDVCRELGIPCISLLGMLRREGITL